MMNKNSPSVKKVTGNVKTTKAGRTNKLRNPINKAAAMAVAKLEISTPVERWAKASKAVAWRTHVISSFITAKA
jgi:hypothetical protein